ncbi:MAG TPA: ATP-dependent DNA ligase [Thermoplasmata archaeon]|nr:ATP-dependent DNA ligase [Thermoplasmata archaeon]
MTTPPPETLFAALARLARHLEATPKRLEKRGLLAEFLRSLQREEIAPAVHLVVGRIFAEADARALNVGWATLRRALEGKRQTTLVAEPLTVLEASRAFAAIAATHGPDSVRERRRLLESLLGRVDPADRDILLRILFGEMRIGVNEGVMLEGIAEAADLPAENVRTAHMFLGDLGRVAEIALSEGLPGLRSAGLRLLSPVKPMLAEMAEDPDDVLTEHGGETAIEFKLDGARIQIHRDGDAVRIFSRRLTDVTDSLPELVAFAKSLPASRFLLEGEVVAVDHGGRPLPFQDLMRRFRRVHGIEEASREIPLKLFLFDLLTVDGRDLVDAPYRERWSRLEALVPRDVLTPRTIARTKGEIEAFLQRSLEEGHEGLMAKALDAPYSVGKRGKKWFKIKPADRLDLVIVAAEWGSGRRQGWLSNYWLAVRDAATGRFQMIGKTFKGLTDEEFILMTERMKALAVSEERWGYHVRPEVVVEVAYNEIQKSPHYPSGFALRFARIARIRDDKGPEDADTYARLKELYERQFERKGRAPAEL